MDISHCFISNVQRVALTGRRCNIYIQHDLHPVSFARSGHAPSCHDVTLQESNRRRLNQ